MNSLRQMRPSWSLSRARKKALILHSGMLVLLATLLSVIQPRFYWSSWLNMTTGSTSSSSLRSWILLEIKFIGELIIYRHLAQQLEEGLADVKGVGGLEGIGKTIRLMRSVLGIGYAVVAIEIKKLEDEVDLFISGIHERTNVLRSDCVFVSQAFERLIGVDKKLFQLVSVNLTIRNYRDQIGQHIYILMDQLSKLQLGLLVENRFKLLKKIGYGSFGVVYQAFDQEHQEYCAVKLEPKGVRPSLMNREIVIMQRLHGISGFPQLISHGRERNFSFYSVPLLGDNLEILLRRCGGRFSLQTVLQLAIQIVDRLEVFHSLNLIHRDVKPENFMISNDDASLVYLIDFGLSKYYRTTEGRHIEFVQKSGVIGTARYASINALQWMEQSRRDDLEAVGYMLIYLVKGELPWQNIRARTKEEKYEQILQMKMGYSLNHLCVGLPKCFVTYFQHVKSLLFQQQPNYPMLRSVFEKQLSELDSRTLFDWEDKAVTMEGLVDPRSVESVRPTQEFEQIPEEEGEAIDLSKGVQIKKKFMKQLHEKYDDPNAHQRCSIDQGTSKQLNYQMSNNLLKIVSEPLLLQEQQQFTKRKDSKSFTSFKQAQEFKENRKIRSSNDDYDLDVAHDDDPQLIMQSLQVKYFLK